MKALELLGFLAMGSVVTIGLTAVLIVACRAVYGLLGWRR